MLERSLFVSVPPPLLCGFPVSPWAKRGTLEGGEGVIPPLFGCRRTP